MAILKDYFELFVESEISFDTISKKWKCVSKTPNTVWKSFVLSNFHFSGVAFGGLDYFHRSLYRVYMAASNAIEHSKLYASIAVHITFVNVVCLYAYAWMGVWEHLQIWSIYDVRVYVIPKCWTWMEQSCMVERYALMMMMLLPLLHNPTLALCVYLYPSRLSRFCTRTILICMVLTATAFKRHFQCIVVCEHVHKRESERKIQNGTSLFLCVYMHSYEYIEK